jgi:hypothetical protein
LGANKFAVKIDRVDGGVLGAPIEVAIAYDSFRNSFGGDWAGRLKVVQLPPCAGQKDCVERPIDVPFTNDLVNGVVKAKFRLGSTRGPSLGKAAPLPAAAGGVFALVAGSSSALGDYTASPLSKSASWAVGQQTGAFTYSYPIQVPPMPGVTPSVSLSYNSQVLDGMTPETNNQGSQVAPGWDLSAGGFIERSYKVCPTGSPDFCPNPSWRGWTLNLNGHSTEILPTGANGGGTSTGAGDIWKLKDDPPYSYVGLVERWRCWVDNDR